MLLVKVCSFLMMSVLCIFCFLHTSLSALVNQDDPYVYLDTLAIKAGTDKSSLGHNYTRAYAQHFHALRNEPLKFLEIGIQSGYSVKLWEEYFPKAELHFIDIARDRIKYHSQRSEYHFVDQTNNIGLQTLMESLGGQFDIIIDDGGHTMDQQMISFESLFPYVKSGGMYIIEDLHTSYWKQYGGNGSFKAPLAGPGTCVNFLQNLVDDLNYSAAVTRNANSNRNPPSLKARLSYYQDNIEALYFYKSMCFVIKK